MDLGLLFWYLFVMLLPALVAGLIFFWLQSIRVKKNEAAAHSSIEELWQQIGLVGEDPASFTIIAIRDPGGWSGRRLVMQDGQEAGYFIPTRLTAATFQCGLFSGGLWIDGQTLHFRDGLQGTVTGLSREMNVKITFDGDVYSFPRGVNEKDVLKNGDLIGRCLLMRTRTLKLLAIRRDVTERMMAAICWLI